MSQPFVLKATVGPPDRVVNFLYSECPKQKDYLVRVNNIESAQRLMKVNYELIEDPLGQIDRSKMPLTPGEAANFLNIAQSTVYKYIKNFEESRDAPQLEGRKDGDVWKISRSSAERLRMELEG